MNRYYKRGYASIIGTEPEYTDCKQAVTSNPDKYKYTAVDYPCAKPAELEAYSAMNINNNIADCYQDLFAHRITHASKHEKLKLGDVGLALKVPGFIDKSGQSTFYNVNKDCSITVTTVSLYTGLIIKQEIMSRGSFNSKFKIDDTPPVPSPAPVPSPTPSPVDDIGGIIQDGIDAITQNITKPPYVYIVAIGGAFVVLKMFKVIR